MKRVLMLRNYDNSSASTVFVVADEINSFTEFSRNGFTGTSISMKKGCEIRVANSPFEVCKLLESALGKRDAEAD